MATSGVALADYLPSLQDMVARLHGEMGLLQIAFLSLFPSCRASSFNSVCSPPDFFGSLSKSRINLGSQYFQNTIFYFSWSYGCFWFKRPWFLPAITATLIFWHQNSPWKLVFGDTEENLPGFNLQFPSVPTSVLSKHSVFIWWNIVSKKLVVIK